jgi:hypothetical protein
MLSNYEVTTDTTSKDIIACAEHSYEEGWYTYDLEALNGDNRQKAYASGFLEGYIYYKQINNHYDNILSSIYNGKLPSGKVWKYMEDQIDYLDSLTKKFVKSNYEETLLITVRQYRGLQDGYMIAAEKAGDKVIPMNDFYYITMQADLEDITAAFDVFEF